MERRVGDGCRALDIEAVLHEDSTAPLRVGAGESQPQQQLVRPIYSATRGRLQCTVYTSTQLVLTPIAEQSSNDESEIET